MVTPWIALQEVCHMYGCTYETCKNKIAAGRFPVATYKVGKKHVVDRVVHEEYFRQQRERGLAALRSTNGSRNT